jgi:hypothetical protein
LITKNKICISELQDRFSEEVIDRFRTTFELEGFSQELLDKRLEDYR